MSDKELEIYININGVNIRVGILFVNTSRGKEVYSFEYDNEYLAKGYYFVIDPEIEFVSGRQYKTDSSKLYGFLADCIPDRWGKNLIHRRENELAKKENRPVNHFGESDYLIRVNDEIRMGAIRIKYKGEFVSTSKESIPILLYLNKLEHECYNIDDLDDNQLKDLFEPGSSLGGARPKATIFNNKNDLYIAKFSAKNDEYNVPLLEKLNNDLAKLCGLNVPESKLLKSDLGDDKSIFLVKRFDRNKEYRYPFVSMMTLLNAQDGDSGLYSYLDLADVIKQYSIHAKDDCLELYKRLIFNCIIHNSDDHLRNHGLINYGNGYQLSPLFDINTSFYNSQLTLSIDNNTHDMDLNTVIKACKYFDINEKDAIELVENMKNIILNNIDQLAQKLGVHQSIINEYKRLIFHIGNSVWHI